MTLADQENFTTNVIPATEIIIITTIRINLLRRMFYPKT